MRININQVKEALIMVIWVFLLAITGYKIPVLCILGIYVTILYLGARKNYSTLLFFLIFIASQNIILVLNANSFGPRWTTLYALSKEVMLYEIVALAFISQTRHLPRSPLGIGIAFFFITVFAGFFLSDADIFAKAVSFRQLTLPFVLFLVGCICRINHSQFGKYCNNIVFISCVVGIIGLFEFFIFKDSVWLRLPIYQYNVNKGTTFDFYNGVPLNFYTWDYVDIIGKVCRRLVSVFADPLTTGHFLLLGFVLAKDRGFHNTKCQYIVSLLLFACSLLTLSKGIYVMVLVYASMQCLKKYPYPTIKNVLAGCSITAVLGIAGIYYIVQKYLPASSIAIHMNGFAGGIMQIRLLGAGLGKAGVLIHQVALVEDTLTAESFIGVLAPQLGILGLFFYILVLLMIAKALIKIYKKTNYDLCYSMSSLLIGCLAESFFSETSTGLVATGLYFILSGILISSKELLLKSAET